MVEINTGSLLIEISIIDLLTWGFCIAILIAATITSGKGQKRRDN